MVSVCTSSNAQSVSCQFGWWCDYLLFHILIEGVWWWLISDMADVSMSVRAPVLTGIVYCLSFASGVGMKRQVGQTRISIILLPALWRFSTRHSSLSPHSLGVHWKVMLFNLFTPQGLRHQPLCSVKRRRAAAAKHVGNNNKRSNRYRMLVLMQPHGSSCLPWLVSQRSCPTSQRRSLTISTSAFIRAQKSE